MNAITDLIVWRGAKSMAALIMSLLITATVYAQHTDEQKDYFSRLSSLCGERFVGEMTFPDDEQHDFAGKVLTASFEQCSQTEVRVAFQVGDDRSRTWVFSKLSDALELKHDHRHKDGTADDVSNYGGATVSIGTAYSQSFVADEFTQKLLPDAATNVWSVSFASDQSVLSYYLERHNKPRFSADLKRVKADDS